MLDVDVCTVHNTEDRRGDEGCAGCGAANLGANPFMMIAEVSRAFLEARAKRNVCAELVDEDPPEEERVHRTYSVVRVRHS